MTDHNHALIQAGAAAAQAFDDYKENETLLLESFGKPADATRKLLKVSVDLAFKDDFDLSDFKGGTSRFKFPELGTHIELVSSVKPTEHASIEEIDAMLERAEARVKELKARRKATIDKLAIKGHIDLVAQSPTLRFKRIAKA